MIKVKTISRQRKLSFWESLYLPEIIRGLWITIRHFIGNLIHPLTRMTVEYPEKKKNLPVNYRGEHRLMIRQDGSIRCTACMLCATACPADCITIVAEESPDHSLEKRAKEFTINELRCVYCGLCVEACPCDAIRMDTYKYENSNYKRENLIWDKNKLLNNHPEGGTPYSSNL